VVVADREAIERVQRGEGALDGSATATEAGAGARCRGHAQEMTRAALDAATACVDLVDAGW
jgi:hypothetical protein